ncbi:MAG: OmpA family protein [Cytophagales bacterium]|nr:MAG: OmpA family protein [Cytophagales bacterium]
MIVKKFNISLFFLLFLIYFKSFAQEIQWACRVSASNDMNNSENWSVKNILGIPNTYPRIKIGSSWAMGLSDNEVETKEEVFVKVQFCKAIKAQQVVIVENMNPGAIKEVYLYDNKSNERLIYTSEPKDEALTNRLLAITFEPMDGDITSLKVVADPSKSKGFNCIDAIGLSTSKEKIALKINEHNDKRFLPTIQFIGSEINTEYDEYSPVISPDGNTLYFARLGHPGNVAGEAKGDLDIWYSNKQKNGKWSEAKNLGAPLNNKDHNFVAAVAANGNTLLLGNTYHTNGAAKSEGCSVSHLTGNVWSMPKNIGVSSFFNNHEHVSFFMGNNEKVMLMAIEDKDQSFGEQDIYVSFEKGDGTWSSPLNLGSTINTVNSETNIFLAPDMKTLYFSSNGYYGYGGYDIYMSKRLDDSWQSWTKPVNLGSIVNSEEDEFCFVITEDGRFAYGYKYFNDKKKHDIYVIGLPPDATLLKNEPVLRVKGKIFNADTKGVLPAKLIFIDSKTKQEMAALQTNEIAGTYEVVLPKGTQYTVNVSSNGFISASENILVSSDTTFQDIYKDISLIPIEVGKVVKLNNLLFQRGQAEMLESSYTELDNVVNFMEENPTVVIQLEGHTDNQGDPKGNMILSERRVRIVKQYMVKKGIVAKRILFKAFGGTMPLYNNGSEETRKLNRRVEFMIIKK